MKKNNVEPNQFSYSNVVRTYLLKWVQVSGANTCEGFYAYLDCQTIVFFFPVEIHGGRRELGRREFARRELARRELARCELGRHELTRGELNTHKLAKRKASASVSHYPFSRCLRHSLHSSTPRVATTFSVKKYRLFCSLTHNLSQSQAFSWSGRRKEFRTSLVMSDYRSFLSSTARATTLCSSTATACYYQQQLLTTRVWTQMSLSSLPMYYGRYVWAFTGSLSWKVLIILRTRTESVNMVARSAQKIF